MSEFIQGFQTTEGEKKYDYNALGNLPDLTISKEDVTGALGFVPPSKAEVEASVKVASNAAATADSKAVAAQTTANQAVGAAQQAQSTADGAVLAAQNAQDRADDAHERIDDSQTQVVQGSIITIDDCDNAPLQNLRIFGKTTQNGIPTPDAPVALDSVEDPTVTVCGKNLVDSSSFTPSWHTHLLEVVNGNFRIYSTTNEPWVSTKSNFITLYAGVTYTLSGKVVAITSGVPRIALRDSDNMVKVGVMPTKPGWYKCTYTPSENIDVYVSLFATDGTASIGDVTYSDIQLEIGSVATEYEPYKDGGSLILFTPNGLPGIPVESGGNYTDPVTDKQWICDEVDFEKGVYVQRIGKVTAEDLSGGGYDQFSNVARTGFPIKNKATATPLGLSTHLPMLTNYTIDTPHFYAQNSQLWVFAPVASLPEASANGIKQWIAEHNVEFIYRLAEENSIPLSKLDPDALTQYAALHSNYPNTTIFNDAAAHMEVQYATPSAVLSLSGGRMNGSIDMVNHQLTGLPAPKNNTDAVSLEYLQETKLELAQGINDVSDIAYGAQETADEALEEAVEANERIDNSQVQVVKGEVVSVGNSADAPLQGLKVFGKTEQKTTTGKNLISFEVLQGFNSTQWAEATIDGQPVNTIDVSTSNYDWATVGSIHTELPTAGVYSFSAYVYAPSTTICRIGIYVEYGTTHWKEYSLSKGWTRISVENATLQAGVKYAFMIRPIKSMDVDVSFNRCMVELSASVTEYEPYTGGKPSPSPEYPQKLSSVGDVNVTVCGKNLLDYSARIEGQEILHTTGGTSAASDWYVTPKIAVSPSTTYTMSGLSSETRVEFDENDNVVLISKTGKTFTTTENTRKVYFNSKSQGYDKPQLEFGSTATKYEPYKDGGTLTLSTPHGLPGISVTSGGNYTDGNGQQWVCDEVDFEKGVYVQRVGQITYDGTQTWNNLSENRFFIGIHDGNTAMANALCSKYKRHIGALANITDKTFYMGISSSSGIRVLYVKDSNYTDRSELHAAFTASPMDFQYILETPIETTLTAEELTQYATLRSNYPNTTVYNDGGADMEVKYATPTSVLPITGGAVSRLEVPTPTKPNEAANKDYVDKNVNTIRNIISSFHSNIVEEASGEMIQVYGSAEAPLSGMRVFGKTEQKTTTGKNLLENKLTSQIINGVTFTVNDDGSITVNGTASQMVNANLDTEPYYLVKGKSYVLESGYTQSYPLLTSSTYYIDGTNKTDVLAHDRGAVTIGENVDYVARFRLFIPSGTTVNNVTVKPMLRLSSDTDNTYEPYTGGIPSPNPDYPQALESVGDVRVGKNLIYCPDNTFTDRGVTTVVNNGCATLNGTSDAAVNITLSTYAAGYRTHLPAGTYTFSGHSGTSGYTLIFVYYDTNEATSSTKYIEIYQATGSRTVTFESDVWLGCYIYGTGAGVSYDNVRVCPQVELGSTATAYEPYTIKGGMPNVIVCGKNLFDYKRLPTKTYNGMTVTNNGDGSFTLPNGGTGEFLYYKDYSNAESKRIFRPGTYMLSLGLKNGATTRPYFFVGFRDAKGSVKELTNEGSTFTLTKERIESDGFFVRVGFYMSASSIATGETVYPMLRMFGDDTFENYKEPQTLPILAYDGLPGIPVSSGGNYTDENGQQWICDEVDVARGKYVQRLCTVSFDGSADESMDYTVDNTTACGGWVRFAIPYMAKSDNNITPNLLCNRFIAVRNNTGVFTEGVCTISSSKEHMAFISSMFYSVDTARTWFALHPITAIYEMETPIEIALSTEQLAAYTNKYGSTAKIYGKTIQIGTPSPKKPIKLINTSLVLTNTATGLTGLPGIPVNSGGNYTDSNGQQWICDEVDFEKGVYVQRVAFGTLTGDDVVGVQTDKSTDLSVCVGFGTPFDKVKGLKNRYCLTDVFPTYYGVNPQNIHSLGDIENAGFHNSADYCSYLYARIYRSRLATQDLAGVKDFLNNHNINILYQLATPIEIALPAEQLAEFADLHTNYSNTTVFNDKDAEMEMKYVADTKIYIDSKFDKLAEILVNKL